MTSSTPRTFQVLALAAVLVGGALGATLGTGLAESHYEQTSTFVTSADGTQIDINVCKPAGASTENPVPVVLHSHGWGGSKSDCSSFDAYYDAGFGVVSITQRGFGNSGGQAHVHDPHFEAEDNMAVINHTANLDWVLTEDSDHPWPDPVLGAIGGSYGGGYQFITALEEINRTGDTRLDALVPEITWHDLPQSLAPNKVIRSVWVDALYAAGSANVHDGIHEAYAYGMATGQLPDGTAPGVYNIVQDFYGNSPAWYDDHGIELDVPTLIGQGLTDNLFNLNQGIHNYQQVLSEDARKASYLIGYNGGHALPNAFPLGTTASGDPCSQFGDYDGFGDLGLAFLENQLLGADNPMPEEAYSLATDEGTCVTSDDLNQRHTVTLDLPVATPTAGGAPQYVALAEGPMTVAGIPQFEAAMTNAGVDARAFLALAVGTSPADAQVLSNNVMPVQKLTPALQEPVSTELAGVATELQEGETLYLVVTPTSDMFIHHGSRTPGAIVFQDVTVDLPVLGQPSGLPLE